MVGAALQDMRATCAALDEEGFIRHVEQLRHFDWLEAVFRLYSRDGEYLTLEEFARVVLAEYDFGDRRQQLPQESWEWHQWANFALHFGAEPQRGFDRRAFVAFDTRRRRDVARGRWRFGGCVQPGDGWRTRHARTFEAQTRTTLAPLMRLRTGTDLLVEPLPDGALGTADGAEDSADGHFCRDCLYFAVTCGLISCCDKSGAQSGDSPQGGGGGAADAGEESLVPGITQDENLYPAPQGEEVGPGTAAPSTTTTAAAAPTAQAVAPTPSARIGAAPSQLQHEAAYPSFCRAVEPVDALALPDSEAVLSRVRKDGTTSMVR